jgi:hypothetical protein
MLLLLFAFSFVKQLSYSLLMCSYDDTSRKVGVKIGLDDFFCTITIVMKFET